MARILSGFAQFRFQGLELPLCVSIQLADFSAGRGNNDLFRFGKSEQEQLRISAIGADRNGGHGHVVVVTLALNPPRYRKLLIRLAGLF